MKKKNGGGGGGGGHSWTLILAPPPRDELGLHLVDILFHSGIKVDFTEAWGGIQRGSRTERKCVMMSVVTGAAFGQFGLLAALRRGDGELRPLFFFSCIINVISDGNTALTHAAGTGEFVCPIRKNVLPFTRQERRYCVAEKLHRHMHASLILFFFSSGILRKGCME